jgi:hypothetical protein
LQFIVSRLVPFENWQIGEETAHFAKRTSKFGAAGAGFLRNEANLPEEYGLWLVAQGI